MAQYAGLWLLGGGEGNVACSICDETLKWPKRYGGGCTRRSANSCNETIEMDLGAEHFGGELLDEDATMFLWSDGVVWYRFDHRAIHVHTRHELDCMLSSFDIIDGEARFGGMPFNPERTYASSLRTAPDLQLLSPLALHGSRSTPTQGKQWLP